VGADSPGEEILTRLKALGLPTGCISVDPVSPTGTVSVEVHADGQPSFTIHPNVAWDHLHLEDEVFRLAGRANAICFGSLGQRTEQARSAIRTLIAAAPGRTLRVFDINLRQHYFSEEVIQDSLEIADVLKLNDAELPVLAEMFALPGDVPGQLRTLAQLFDLDTVALTRGANGSLLLHGKRISDHPGLAVNVVDTIGAGDAFTAAMTLGLLADRDLDEINAFSNGIAARVCGHAGAVPQTPA
jgi:fructokinase